MGLRVRINWYVILTILNHECIRWKLRKELRVKRIRLEAQSGSCITAVTTSAEPTTLDT